MPLLGFLIPCTSSLSFSLSLFIYRHSLLFSAFVPFPFSSSFSLSLSFLLPLFAPFPVALGSFIFTDRDASERDGK